MYVDRELFSTCQNQRRFEHDEQSGMHNDNLLSII